MQIILFKFNKKSYHELYSTLNSRFCNKAKINSKILDKIKVVFVVLNKKKKINGVCGLYVTSYKTNELFIALEKKIRNKGIGKKLMNRLVKWSKKNKVNFFIQSIDHKYYFPALQLYHSFGYKRKYSIGKKII